MSGSALGPPVPVHYHTPDEVNGLVPRLQPLLGQLQAAWHEERFARDQLDDLRRVHGNAPEMPAHPENAEYARWSDASQELRRRVEALAQEIRALGAHVADPAMGVADFYAQRDGETVFLSYRADEAGLESWRPLTARYEERRPIAEF